MSILEIEGGEKMKEEKGVVCHTCTHRSKGDLLITVGIVAIVYGVVNYIRTSIGVAWPPYTGWLIGGAALIVVGFIKGYWLRKCC